MLDHIILEVNSAKYFSVSIDSTPDASHIDQLTCIPRYVLPSGPVERFVTFLDMQGHSGRELAESLLKFLRTHGIGITDCRGESYDNTSNTSGKFNGMQAIIRQHCEMAHYVRWLIMYPALHILLTWLVNLQQVAVWPPASTHRWKVPNDKLSSRSLPTIKHLSDTRWSAHADATKTLVD